MLRTYFFRRHALISSYGIVALLGVTGCEGTRRANAVWVDIPSDASVTAVAESLAAHGVVASAGEFEAYALIRRRYRDIKPGIYPLRPGMPMGRVLSVLRRGRPPVTKLIVRERMTLAEVALEVERALGIKAWVFQKAAENSDLRRRVAARAGSLEGYLYPTTYYVDRTAAAHDVLRQMVDTFQARWNPAWYGRLDSLGISRDEAVTLASIIAGEMPLPEDLFHVASVYHNRLARGMRLQADPTVIYALGERRRLNNKDYRTPSEYNTYKIRGLPPGPIGQPSLTSLEAALYPVDSDYLFFVGRRDGRHQFSRTYSEHLQTIAQIRGRKRSVSSEKG